MIELSQISTVDRVPASGAKTIASPSEDTRPTLTPDGEDGKANLKVRVSGPRTAEATHADECLHCGAPLLSDSSRTSGFCCSGCTYVHRLVHEHGLDGYYKIRDPIISPVDPTVFQARDFSWLAELQGVAEKSPATPELELEIQGISCAGCVWLIERLFHQQTGALQIETDAQLGQIRLRWVAGKFDAPAFARTLHSFNYLVGPPGEEPAVPESRQLVRRIGLCAAFAMNVMLFTLPVYFGMAADFAYARLFGLLSMIFATFSVLTGGLYFLNRAIRALRGGIMHIDLPIAVGLTGAYLGSLYGWFSGRGELVYFDFVSAFILLMLVGRWAQTAAVERNRHRLLSGHARPRKVWVNSPQGPIERTVEELAVADVFAVRSGEVVPVESSLESPSATLGTAWINGEADSRTSRMGARVPSGAVNLGRAEISLRAMQPWSASLLAQLLRPARRDAYQHAFLERIIRGYLIGIFVVATTAGLGWWFAAHNAVRTWSIVTAVLVVSCPCAIGLAFPLTDEMATLALRRRGVFIREGDIWPRLARIRKIIFDKTGTLTLETPALENTKTLAALEPKARDALLTIVQNNPHPISLSLYENLLVTRAACMPTNAAPTGGTRPRDGLGDNVDQATRPEVAFHLDEPVLAETAGEINEEVGIGVTLQTATGRWSLGRPGWRGGEIPGRKLIDDKTAVGSDTEFSCDGVVLATFQFSDATRPGIREEIFALQRRGFATYILSGDRQEKVSTMAAALGIAPENAIAGATPADKAAWIKRIDGRDTLMLGDGANDRLAFDAALVRGTPVIHRGVLEGKSDFYYLGCNLAGLQELFNIAVVRRRTQRWLLIFSLAYNTLAVGLAATGRMNPVLAAILMPASSIASLGIVRMGMREAALKNHS